MELDVPGMCVLYFKATNSILRNYFFVVVFTINCEHFHQGFKCLSSKLSVDKKLSLHSILAIWKVNMFGNGDAL